MNKDIEERIRQIASKRAADDRGVNRDSVRSVEIRPDNADKILTAVLGLERSVVGIRRLDREQYEALDATVTRGPVCYLIRRGCEGIHLKSDRDNIACSYGRYAAGVEKTHPRIDNAEGYAKCGLYSSGEIAKEILASFRYITPDKWGLEAGPLGTVNEPDVVIIICDTLQAMRVFQGYAYHYGSPGNLSAIGNQAGCADLISRPYSTNDINISFFCRGARDYGGFTSGEIGISIPKSKYLKVTDGIFRTVDPVCNIKEKLEIEERLRLAGYDHEFDLSASYGHALTELDNEILAETREEQAFK